MKYKKTFVLSLIMNFIMLSCSGYIIISKGGLPYLIKKIPEVISQKESPNEYSFFYADKANLYRLMPYRNDDIYFVGDSITAFGEWHEMLGIANAKNRGIGGDTTAGVLSRLDDIIKGKPAKIFLMIGVNNIIRNISLNQTLVDYREILSKISGESPQTRVYIQCVLPINKNKFQGDINNSDNNRKFQIQGNILKFNEWLTLEVKKYPKYKFIDLPKLKDIEGELVEEYTTDGLHLNGLGMLAWVNSIKRFVYE